MKNNTRLILFISILVLTSLACATLTGNNNGGVNTGGGDTGGNTGGGDTGGDTTPTQAPPTNILYEDDFSDSTSGWDQYSDEDGSTDYVNGQYNIVINIESFFYWANPRKDFTDVVIDVDITRVGGAGEENQFGIVCRHTDVDNWYTLVIGSDGWASIRKRVAGGELEFLAQETDIPAINQGNATNHLRAECVGDRLSLYANGTRLLEYIDAGGHASGDVGLLGGTFDATSVELNFDNFVVTKP
jgi:hypothetical protein